MILRIRIAIVAAVACVITPPVLADQDRDRGRDGASYERKHDGDRHNRYGDQGSEHRDKHFKDRREHAEGQSWRNKHDDKHGGGNDHHANIPAGHLPPPGECRIWHPDRPAGQQPPPGDCQELRHRVPRGAFLVRG
jgi:hypothetical protein